MLLITAVKLFGKGVCVPPQPNCKNDARIYEILPVSVIGEAHDKSL